MTRPALIVRLHNWIGDVVVGLPALQLLAAQGIPLQLVGKGWAGSLLAGHGWTVHRLPAGLRPRVALWRGLRPQAADRAPQGIDALLLATSFSSALECRLAGVRAIGYATDHRRGLLARPLPPPTEGHALLGYWQLACRHLGINAAPPADIGLAVAPAATAQADALLAGRGVRGDYALLCPFATGTMKGQSKSWPGFPALARSLMAQGLPVLLCPGPGEEPAARRDFPQALVLPDVPLGTYAALLQRARLVVANDTGPGHIAAAVGAPLLSVLGPTDAAQWAPWGRQVQRVQSLQAPGGWPALAEVARRAQALLDRPTSPVGVDGLA